MNATEDGKLTLNQKLDLAQKVLRDFHAQCFWYLRADMEVKPSDLEEIVRGLRQNGGRRGFRLAALLCQ